MVVTALPATCDTWVWHEKARLPSMCTMQAPHRPVPHPNLVPVSFNPSRITHNNGVSRGASLDAALPLTVKLVGMACLLACSADASWRRRELGRGETGSPCPEC